MKKPLYLIVCLLALGTALPRLSTAYPVVLAGYVADDEYDMYRKKADEFFKAGRYAEARRYYQNCLEVPGFENDEYATKRIELATRCIVLLGQADEALQSQEDTLMVGLLKQVLTLNATDVSVLNRLAEHYELRGNEQNTADQFSVARTNYQTALDYARASGNRVKQSTLEVQLKNLDTRLDQRENEQETRMRGIPRSPLPVQKTDGARVTVRIPVLKVGLGMVVVGMGLYAYSLRSDFTQKEAALRTFENNNNITPEQREIADPALWEAYQAVRESAVVAQDKQGLYRICLGVAAVAAIADVYLWVRKPRTRQVGFFWQSAPAGYGMAVGYRF
jgi:tetratricopeptide (TPR) repeat protein